MRLIRNQGDGVNLAAPDVGWPGEFFAPVWGFSYEIFISFGVSPIDLAGQPHGANPGGNMQPPARNGLVSPSFENGDYGPAPASFDLGGGNAFAPSIVPGLVPRLDTNANDADPASAGLLSSAPTSAISSLQIMAIPAASGHPASGAFMQNGSIMTPADHTSGTLGSSWMSYVVSGDWWSGGAYSSSMSLAGWTSAADSDGEPISTAAMAAGAAPVSILMAGPETPVQATADDLEQVAELIAPDESSLALAATLWTVPSDLSPGATSVQPVRYETRLAS